MNSDRAFLDTTVQIDRNKTGARREIIDRLLDGYSWKLGTSISQLEFKATIVQECITIHNELVGPRRFTRVRDSLIESSHPQAKLRSHIFNNLIQKWGSSLEIGDDEDRQLAIEARLNLEIIIPDLFTWFSEESVDSIVRERVDCTRAAEPPFKKKAAFDNSMPICGFAKKNKSCTVENAIRYHGPSLIAQIKPTLQYSSDGAPIANDKQLARSVELFEDVIAGRQNDLNHRNCRSCGDCLMAIEAQGTATHVLSTNLKEWTRLAAATGMKCVEISYEGERTS